MPAKKYGLEPYLGGVRTCFHCGACSRGCPEGLDVTSCLSALTQKKGELDDAERARLTSHGIAWGCDRCQNVCPYTKKAIASGSIFTPIGFFYEHRLENIDLDSLWSMSEDEFFERAFSWRGKETLARNLKILGGKE